MILTDEQQMLRDAAQGWVSERAPIAALRSLRREHAALGHDPALYREMAEMGWAGIAVPEADGGFGFGLAGAGVVAEQLGRNLVGSPLLTTSVVAAGAIELAGNAEQKQQWLPAIVAGEVRAALAIDEGHRHDPAAIALPAAAQDGAWVLTGSKQAVFEGPAADLFVIVARVAGQAGDETGLALFLCPADTAGLTVTAMEQIDSRGCARLDLAEVRLPGDALLGEAGNAWPVLAEVLDRGRAVLSAEMLGSAQQAFETTLEYLRTRIQFDQPIGSFQALQHRAAYLIGQLELTRSAVIGALRAMDEGAANRAQLVSLAKAMAGKTLRKVAQETVQLHGGIGMTDEHDAGLYLKRAQVADMTWGNEAFHRQRYARLSGL